MHPDLSFNHYATEHVWDVNPYSTGANPFSWRSESSSPECMFYTDSYGSNQQYQNRFRPYQDRQDSFDSGFESLYAQYAMTSGCAKKSKSNKSSGRMHPLVVARRNERERNRVSNVNATFTTLRQHLPSSSERAAKKMSKVETLRTAIRYIKHLRRILDTTDDAESRIHGTAESRDNVPYSPPDYHSRHESADSGASRASSPESDSVCSYIYENAQTSTSVSSYDSEYTDGREGASGQGYSGGYTDTLTDGSVPAHDLDDLSEWLSF